MAFVDVPVVDVWMQHPTDEFVEFLETYGKENVLFGTNYPMIQPGDCLRGLEELELDETTAELFLYRNAETAFGVDLV